MSLTAIAKEHPRNWLTIAWINTTTVLGDYLGHPQSDGLTWQLIPLFLTVPALAQIWKTRRRGSTLLFTALALLAARHLLLLLRPAALPDDDHRGAHPVRAPGAWSSGRTGSSSGDAAWCGGPSAPCWCCRSWCGPGRYAADSVPERTEQRTAGEWIAENTPEDARIMTRSFHVQGYSDRDVVAMPSAEYRSMLEFARRMGVSYIVADENTIRRRRPEVYDILMRETGAPAGLELVHEFTERGVVVKIYQLDPAAQPTDQPPLPLGYVSD